MGNPSPAVTLVETSDSAGDEVDPSFYTVTADRFVFTAPVNAEGQYTFTFHADNTGGAIDQAVSITVGNAPVWRKIPDILIDAGSEATVDLRAFVSGAPVLYIEPDLASITADPSTYTFDGDTLLLHQELSGTNVFAFTAANETDTADVAFKVIVRRLDTDGDGLPDWWTTMYFGGPTACPNPNLDPDGDRYSTLEEYESSTSPLDRYSQPLPDYLENADADIVTNYVDWAYLHGPDRAGTQEAPFLLNVSPAAAAACTGALLRVSSFATTDVGIRLELASDIPGYRFFQPAGDEGDTVLGNGFVGLQIAKDLASFANPVNPENPVQKAVLPVLAVVDPATGRAVLDLNFGLYLQALGAPPGYMPPLPPSLFARPVLTPIRPDITDFLILYAEP